MVVGTDVVAGADVRVLVAGSDVRVFLAVRGDVVVVAVSEDRRLALRPELVGVTTSLEPICVPLLSARGPVLVVLTGGRG